MPCERRAFHSQRKSRHASQSLECSETLAVSTARHHRMESGEDRLRLGTRLSSNGGGHEARTRFGNRAPGPLEGHVRDSLSFQFEPHRELIPAHRVDTFGSSGGAGHRSKVLRTPILVENDALIQLVKVAVHVCQSRCARVRIMAARQRRSPAVNLPNANRSRPSRSVSTSIVSSTSAANAYVSNARACSAPMPRLFR